MANSRQSLNFAEYITVDTAPGSDGYWTNPVSVKGKIPDMIKDLFFSVREESTGTSVATPTLQFKCSGDTYWTDYYNDGTDFVIGDRKRIDDNGGNVLWRAGIKNGNFTSGKVRLGLDW